jgi:hypothetical protein
VLYKKLYSLRQLQIESLQNRDLIGKGTSSATLAQLAYADVVVKVMELEAQFVHDIFHALPYATQAKLKNGDAELTGVWSAVVKSVFGIASPRGVMDTILASINAKICVLPKGKLSSLIGSFLFLEIDYFHNNNTDNPPHYSVRDRVHRRHAGLPSEGFAGGGNGGAGVCQRHSRGYCCGEAKLGRGLS